MDLPPRRARWGELAETITREGFGMPCRICNGSVLWPFAATEMFYGTRETYEYGSCPTCGGIQIMEIPDEKSISSFYPDRYWENSSGTRVEEIAISNKALQQRVFRHAHKIAVTPAVRRVICAARPRTAMRAIAYGIKPSHRVLDVGCGTGGFIRDIADLGVVEAVGVDPYASESMTFANGAKLERGRLSDMPVGHFDVVTFNHSLEHTPDLVGTLTEAAKRLTAFGHCVVRIPITSCEAFRTYGADWVQLDAPRHLTIPSRRGMAIAAKRAGLALDFTIDDSDAFQFWGSELYRRNIPLRGSETKGAVDPAGVFSTAEMAKFAARARRLNSEGDGDQAVFILKKLQSAM